MEYPGRQSRFVDRVLPRASFAAASGYMDNDLEDFEEKSSVGGWIPSALALLALVLGGAGLFFALDASRRLAPMSDLLAEGVSGVAGLEDRIEKLEGGIAELAEVAQSLQSRMERSSTYTNQNEKAIRKLADEINANRKQIIESAEALAGGGASASRSTAPAGNDVSSATSGGGGSYTIQAGDTFAKIAQQKGVSLQALLDANPGVDARRLRIGQVVVLPSN